MAGWDSHVRYSSVFVLSEHARFRINGILQIKYFYSVQIVPINQQFA